MPYLSINPATEEVIKEYDSVNEEQIKLTLISAKQSQTNWSNLKNSERLKYLENFKRVLVCHQTEIASLISKEMGKLYSAAFAEVSSCLRMCDFLVERAEEILATEIRHRKDANDFKIIKEPFGTILTITPWNYPIWLPLRSSLPALVAGNGVILKPAPNVAGCALYLEKLFLEAGFPENIFQVLLFDNFATEKIISDDLIDKIVFTGSLTTGRYLAKIAGENIKPITLELGGSDSFIVLADCDLAKTARIAAEARCKNAGQICCASKRFLVESKVAKEFEKHFIYEMSVLTPGDPFSESSSYGPLARRDILHKLKTQVDLAKEEGAIELLPSRQDFKQGYFCTPGILTNVQTTNSIYQEEIFGPVAVLNSFETLDEAIQIANSSIYGLGASIFTESSFSIDYLSKYLKVGVVAFNKTVSGDAYVPFGGIKKSGFGKESGKEGLLDYVFIKSVI